MTNQTLSPYLLVAQAPGKVVTVTQVELSIARMACTLLEGLERLVQVYHELTFVLFLTYSSKTAFHIQAVNNQGR